MTPQRITSDNARDRALADVRTERARQDLKWGWTENPDCGMAHGTDDRRLSILLEEVGEVAIALNDHESREALHAELIQVAAVAVAWVQADRELGR